MQNFTIVVHGGAGPDSDHIRNNQKELARGMEEALEKGYEILKKGGKAVDAVEAAVCALEDNPLFNAGRGSALNALAEVEMCASIMDGKTLNSGAVAIVQNVKNPVSLARAVMSHTHHIYLGSVGALNFAKEIDIALRPHSYFVTEHQYEAYEKVRREQFQSLEQPGKQGLERRHHLSTHGTVGAVALDMEGNVAAATSTGGTPNATSGRIGDSSMIGVGTYADNQTCAVSGTGDGEYLIRGVIGHSLSDLIKFRGAELTEACEQIVHKDNADIKGDIGIISVNTKGEVGIAFNSERMLRAWKKGHHATVSRIYK